MVLPCVHAQAWFLYDDFAGPTVDATRWRPFPGSNVSPTIANGKLAFDVPGLEDDSYGAVVAKESAAWDGFRVALTVEEGSRIGNNRGGIELGMLAPGGEDSFFGFCIEYDKEENHPQFCFTWELEDDEGDELWQGYSAGGFEYGRPYTLAIRITDDARLELSRDGSVLATSPVRADLREAVLSRSDFFIVAYCPDSEGHLLALADTAERLDNDALPEYRLEASSGQGGTVSPTDIVVTKGEDADFIAAPEAGYVIDEWELDGVVVQAGGESYTVAGVESDHTLYVSFAALIYRATATAGTHGSVLPTSIDMTIDDEQVFVAAPDEYYSVVAWSIDGQMVQSGGNEYTLSGVEGDRAVSVTFQFDDRDGDGMPDLWEDQYGDLQPDGDEDGDGIPNIVEFQEGLDADSPDDVDYLVLAKGWNLVAVPLATRRLTYDGFFGDRSVGAVWAWDAVRLRYRDAREDEIDRRCGVWVYATGICGVPLE